MAFWNTVALTDMLARAFFPSRQLARATPRGVFAHMAKTSCRLWMPRGCDRFRPLERSIDPAFCLHFLSLASPILPLRTAHSSLPRRSPRLSSWLSSPSYLQYPISPRKFAVDALGSAQLRRNFEGLGKPRIISSRNNRDQHSSSNWC